MPAPTIDPMTPVVRKIRSIVGATAADYQRVPLGATSEGELLNLYGYWAAANNAGAITANQLAKSLVERGFRKHRDGKGVIYRGLKIAVHDQESLN